jgi:carbon-monoxide dehydrogenase medium subunit
VDSTRQLITGIRFPVHNRFGSWGTAWRRVGRREALILPILNCAGKIHIQEEGSERKITHARLALGPAGPVPFRARKAEEFLVGNLPSHEVWMEAGKLTREEAQPRSSIMRASRKYRLEIIPALVEEVLETAWKRAEG